MQAELGKLKLLHLNDGNLDGKYFENIDHVLQDIASFRPPFNLTKGVILEEKDDCDHVVELKTKKSKFQMKVLCSVPYNQKDRENLVQGTVDFVRRLHRKDFTKIVGNTNNNDNGNSNKNKFNKEMDEEVDEIQALRSVKNWRENFMSRIDRNARVNTKKFEELYEYRDENNNYNDNEKENISSGIDVSLLDVKSLLEQHSNTSRISFQ
jgi:hypothetical protein